MAAYGLCKDEFVDNGNWPRMIYLREGRRMVGAYVLTQRDVSRSPARRRTRSPSRRTRSTPITSRAGSTGRGGCGWRVDSGTAGSGDALVDTVPEPDAAASEVTNLLVSVTASATHVAFAALRLEPQYMLMGEAAGAAARHGHLERDGRATPGPVAST